MRRQGGERIGCEEFRRQLRLGRRSFLHAGMLGAGGFLSARDIVAITVNRWPHGYAYEYNPLFDPDWDEHDQPHVVGRAAWAASTLASARNAYSAVPSALYLSGPPDLVNVAI